MARKDRNIAKSTAEYSRIYDQMHGINRSEKDGRGLIYTENMYVDRSSGDDCLESIPGYRTVYDFGKKINGIHCQKLGTDIEHLLIHAGTDLYRFPLSGYNSIIRLSPMIDLNDAKSHSFSFARSLFILDGESIVEINEDGEAKKITEGNCERCYVPLTYLNFKSHEKRNLLSDRFREQIEISSADELSYGTPGLIYSIVSPTAKTCEVSGAGEEVGGEIYIPKYAMINGSQYRVVKIGNGAFSANAKITGIFVARGVEEIGTAAFLNAVNLTHVNLSDTVKTVGDMGFYGCENLEYLRLGFDMKTFGVAVFSGCTRLEEINYAGTQYMTTLIENIETIGTRDVNYNVKDDSVTVGIRVMSDASGIISVSDDSGNLDFEYHPDGSTVTVRFENYRELYGRRISILGTLRPTGGFLSTPQGERLSPQNAILRCNICEVYDGRVFLSGNPTIPGVVFHSSRTKDGQYPATYFSCDDYFIDGVGEYDTVSMLCMGKRLAVFKSDDDGMGSIFLHNATGSNEERSYPVMRIHNKMPALCEACDFLDDSLFISHLGLTRLYDYVSSENAFITLSSEINHMLLKEDLKAALMCMWERYLVISIGNTIYLADGTERLATRRADKRYDWYYLSGIGSYKNDTRVYRYAEIGAEGVLVSDKARQIADGEICSFVEDGGEKIYYVEESGVRYRVFPTKQRVGGVIYPVTAILGAGSLLFFGTSAGALCVFNTDMRGVAPDEMREASDFDAEEYAKTMGNSIHPEFYSFAGHAPRYAVFTDYDGCDPEYLEKSTLPHSTVLRLKCFPKSSVICEIDTGSSFRRYGPYYPTGASFADMSFSDSSLSGSGSVTVAVDDRSHGWTEKQIRIYSDEPESPFGIYMMSYRYSIKGNLKKSKN